MSGKRRCYWADVDDPLYTEYHDVEWGVPVHDDKKLFEFLVLETAQAGLSWRTVLRKRENFRKAFDGFDPERVASYTQSRINRLMVDPGIIRNELKIRSAVQNAKAFLKVREECGSFDSYVWKFVGGRPRTNAWSRIEEIPAVTEESQRMSRELYQRGFKFVGPTVCYAHMQATGMVNDHLTYCYRYSEIKHSKRP